MDYKQQLFLIAALLCIQTQYTMENDGEVEEVLTSGTVGEFPDIITSSGSADWVTGALNICPSCDQIVKNMRTHIQMQHIELVNFKIICRFKGCNTFIKERDLPSHLTEHALAPSRLTGEKRKRKRKSYSTKQTVRPLPKNFTLDAATYWGTSDEKKYWLEQAAKRVAAQSTALQINKEFAETLDQYRDLSKTLTDALKNNKPQNESDVCFICKLCKESLPTLPAFKQHFNEHLQATEPDLSWIDSENLAALQRQNLQIFDKSNNSTIQNQMQTIQLEQ